MSVTNVSATSCANWRAALARQEAGGEPATVFCCGDSNTDLNVAWWTKTLDRLRVSQPNTWAQSFQFLTLQLYADPLQSFGTDWYIANGGEGPSISGALTSTFGQDSAGEFTYGPVYCDTFTLWYLKSSIAGKFQYAIDDGSFSALIDCYTGGAREFIPLTIPAGDYGPHSLRLKCVNTPSTGCGFMGIEYSYSLEPRRGWGGHGRFGAATSDWVDESSLRSIYDNFNAPDLTIAVIGSNDYGFRHISTATTLANLSTWIDRCRANDGDFLLYVPGPSSYGEPPAFPQPPTDLISGLYDLSASKDVPLVDLWARWIDYPTAHDVNHFISDHVHFTDAGHQDVAALMEEAVLAMSDESADADPDSGGGGLPPDPNWVPIHAERWNGSAWETVVAERWNGDAWDQVQFEEYVAT